MHTSYIQSATYRKLTIKFVMEVGSSSTTGKRESGMTLPLLSFTMTPNVIKEFLDTTVSFGCSNENDNPSSIIHCHIYIL